jgi:hypothetical protein
MQKTKKPCHSSSFAQRGSGGGESTYVVENSFAGSLPGFWYLSSAGKTISEEEAAEIKR